MNGHRFLSVSPSHDAPFAHVLLSLLTGRLHKLVADSTNSKREESEHGIESLLCPSVLQHAVALSDAFLLDPSTRPAKLLFTWLF